MPRGTGHLGAHLAQGGVVGQRGNNDVGTRHRGAGLGHLQAVAARQLQALAVSTPSRSPSLPQVPTTVEAGVAGSDYTFWVGMIVASATPAPVVKRLHEEALKAMAHPEVKERMNKLGAEPFPLSVEAFNAFIKTEVDAAARIAKAAGLKGQ